MIISYIVPIVDHLFPFGEAVGDNLVTPGVLRSSPIIFKAIACPFFGVQEDILFVSTQLGPRKRAFHSKRGFFKGL